MKLSTTGVRAVLSLGLTFLPGRRWTSTGFSQNVKRTAEIVKGCFFHCITPCVIIIVASKAFGAWLPQEFALDWEFHDKVRQFRHFLGGSSDNLDSKDSLFIITSISPGLLPCHKLLLTWTDQRTGLEISNLFKNSGAISKTHIRPFPIWSVRAKYGYKPPTSAWVWMLRNAPKYQFCSFF